MRAIALLRGINVGGHRKVKMAELREVAAAIGFDEVATYIQSGNLTFESSASTAECEARLAAAIESHFGFSVPVIVRTAAEWATLMAANPFSDAAEERPKFLHAALAASPIPAEASDSLTDRLKAGERVQVAGGAIWIDYAGGVGRSKLTPKLLDRAAGSPVTARNWRTMVELARRLSE